MIRPCDDRPAPWAALTGLLLLVIPGAPETAQAATLHVDVKSSACSDSLSRAQNSATKPFCTIQRAAQVTVAGDLVLVGDGVYPDADGDGISLKVNRSGTASAPVTFRAASKHKAVIQGKLPASSTSFTYCVNLGTGTQHVVIEGFEIAGCTEGVNINNDNHYIVVRGNRIHEMGRRVTDTQSGQDGVSVGNTCSHVTIDGNLFYTIGRLPGSIYQNHDHGIYLRGTHVSIVNNVFYDIRAGWAVHIYSPGHWKEYIDIINNTFADPNPARDGHVLIYPETRHLLVQNNISHAPRAAFIRNNSCTSVSDVTISNNLTDVAALISGPACNFVLSGNLTGKQPMFVDSAQHNYHLLAGSPAIDAGLLAKAPPLDHDGLPRPAGPAVDLGAFEHPGATPAGDGPRSDGPRPDAVGPATADRSGTTSDGSTSESGAASDLASPTTDGTPAGEAGPGLERGMGSDGCSCGTGGQPAPGSAATAGWQALLLGLALLLHRRGAHR